MRQSLVTVELDEVQNIQWNQDIRRERMTAISDLLEENSFIVKSAPEAGPYHLQLSVTGQHLQFIVYDIDGEQIEDIALTLSSFREAIEDYSTVFGQLATFIEVDEETARRLFTLICVLNLRDFAR